MKRLHRSRTERTFLGILGGMGEYFGVDPVVIRVICVFLMIATGVLPFLLAYAVAYYIIPLEPERQKEGQ